MIIRLSKLGITSFVMLSFLSFNTQAYEAPKARKAPVIDGQPDDSAWAKASWQALDQHILGDIPRSDDFSGRFKVVWNKHRIFILAEIVDDVIIDRYPDPLTTYWDDDCLEIFIDEDHSGGLHQFSFNAFAYHIALDNQAIDIGPNNADGSANFITLNDHVKSAWRRSVTAPNKIYWEVALDIYDDRFTLSPTKHQSPVKPVKLKQGKVMGFMLAYCDNDGSEEREHFMGSEKITPVNGNKNLGYIDAGVFGELKLVK